MMLNLDVSGLPLHYITCRLKVRVRRCVLCLELIPVGTARISTLVLSTRSASFLPCCSNLTESCAAHLRFDDTLELVCPSEIDVEPGMCLVFELFLLRGLGSPVDKAGLKCQSSDALLLPSPAGSSCKLRDNF